MFFFQDDAKLIEVHHSASLFLLIILLFFQLFVVFPFRPQACLEWLLHLSFSHPFVMSLVKLEHSLTAQLLYFVTVIHLGCALELKSETGSNQQSNKSSNWDMGTNLLHTHLQEYWERVRGWGRGVGWWWNNLSLKKRNKQRIFYDYILWGD